MLRGARQYDLADQTDNLAGNFGSRSLSDPTVDIGLLHTDPSGQAGQDTRTPFGSIRIWSMGGGLVVPRVGEFERLGQRTASAVRPPSRPTL